MDNGITINSIQMDLNMGLDITTNLINTFIKVNLPSIKSMEKGFLVIQMDNFIKVNGSKERNMVMVF